MKNPPPRTKELTKRFQKKKQERFPMKALLRSSLIALMLLGGYAGLTTHANATSMHLPGLPMPPAK